MEQLPDNSDFEAEFAKFATLPLQSTLRELYDTAARIADADIGDGCEQGTRQSTDILGRERLTMVQKFNVVRPENRRPGNMRRCAEFVLTQNWELGFEADTFELWYLDDPRVAGEVFYELRKLGVNDGRTSKFEICFEKDVEFLYSRLTPVQFRDAA